MAIVNKILNVLVLLLAIAACIAAVLLHERRIELRGRADAMAHVLDRVAQISDGNGETASELNASGKVNDKTLDWESYHLAIDKDGKYDSWKDNVASIEGKLEQLYAMKIDLADALLKVSENIEYSKPEGIRASLNSVDTFLTFTELIQGQSVKVRKRDNRLAQALVQVSAAIKKMQTENGFKHLSDKDRNEPLEENIDTLLSDASALYGRTQLLAGGLNNLTKAFKADLDGDILFRPKWNGADFKSESVEEINNAFALLQEDLKVLNGELYKLKVANGMIEDQRVKLVRLDTTIEELNSVNDDLKNLNGNYKAQIGRLKKELAANRVPEGFSAKEINASVVEVNDRYNFIVINRGKKDGLVLNAKLMVHDNGRFVCRVKATKVYEGTAICEILAINGTRAQATESNMVPSLGARAVTVNE